MKYKSFKLFNRTIKVKYVSKSNFNEDHGQYKHDEGVIYIEEGSHDSVFWHEVSHCILDTLNYNDLSENEQFVDLVGQCLSQLMETLKRNE